MKKYWYILYSRPGTEKKISASLTKRRVEHFLPMSFQPKSRFSGKPVKEPLFPGYIFILVTPSELPEIQNAVGALSHVYWKNEPIVVPFSDILRIKEFTEMYEHIQLIPTKVFLQKKPVENPSLFVVEKSLTPNKLLKKINISSIGFTLLAIEQDKFENTKIIFIPDSQKILN